MTIRKLEKKDFILTYGCSGLELIRLCKVWPACRDNKLTDQISIHTQEVGKRERERGGGYSL